MRETDFVGRFAKGLRVFEAFNEARPRLSICWESLPRISVTM